MTRYRRLTGYTVLIAAAMMMSGCFGTFSLTRTIYRSNHNVYGSVPGDNTQRKIAQSAVMWLFIPVYAVSGIADMAVFNVIEFWTGNRTEIGMLHDADGTNYALLPSRNGKEAVLTVSRGSQVVKVRLIKQSTGELEIREMNGDLKGTAIRTKTGEILLKDASGHTRYVVNARD